MSPLVRDTFGPFLALVLVVALVAATTPSFLDAGNMSNLILQVSIVAIVAIGSSLVIFTGGIDLSPGSMIALISMLFASAVKFGGLPLPLGVLAALAAGVALGALNGALVAYGRIPSFIVTLAGLSMFRGLAFMFNHGSPVFTVSPLLEPLFYGTVAHVPLPLFYVLALYGAVVWMLRWTVLGRCIYAVGGNPNAARLSGIPVPRIQLAAFTLAGAAAALGAVLMAARLNSGSPNYGVGLELSAIAAAVIGGASLSGGRGNILNTLTGAMTIVVVQNGLNLNAVPTSAQNVITGAIILCAVGLDTWRPGLGRIFAIHRPRSTS